jgi:drug/metabolite transporter (DMT)-like permease
MNHTPADTRRGIALALTAFSVWAWGDAAVKHIGSSVSLYTIAFYDIAIIVAILTGLGVWGKLGTLREAVFSPHWKWHALRGGIIYVQFLAGMYAFTHLPLARAYTLMFSMPLMAAPLSLIFMKERVPGRKWAVIALGFCGVLVVLRPGLIAPDFASIVALVSAVLFAAGNLIARHIGLKGEKNQLSFAYLPEFVCFLCTIPFYLYMDGFSVPGLHDMMWIVFIGIVSAIGFVCLSTAFATTPAATVAPFHYTQILWAVLFGYFFFGETPDQWVGAGALIIIASGLWLITQEGRLSADPLPDPISVQAPVD